MNPLIVLFILSIALEDYFYRQGTYFRLFFYSICIYWLFYLFQTRSAFHSPNKKFNMAAYSQSFDPTIYAKVNFNVSEALKFINEYNLKLKNKTIGIFHYWIKVVGEVFKSLPECNEVIRFGLKVRRDDVDIGLIIKDTNSYKMTDIVIRDVPNKTLEQIYDDINLQLSANKEDKSKHSIISYLPSLYIIYVYI